MISSLASSTISPIATIGDNAILRIDLSGSITDKPYNKSLQELVNNDGNASNLYEILGAIDHASTDSNIKGIYINCDGAGMGVASATAIRNAFGMSTACEALAARHMGLEVCGISCITNLAAGLSDKKLNHKEVQETADRVAKQFTELITAVVRAV